jgi:hypothetical protein
MENESAPREPAGSAPEQIQRTCRTHGETIYVRYGERDHFRCLSCRRERVIARRRKVKQILVEEAGGACVLCGYDRCQGALHFHHRDPATKEFALAHYSVPVDTQRRRSIAGQISRGSGEMRPSLRQLPRGGRGGVDWATLVPHAVWLT